ncbi:hypothetical protein J4Q44_G00178540 [Coregonus suidteri]|uniref:Uncharacterized protein n=1 Tax=Coregonus suidteri TaxID=861788 RepID=A0AAN8LTX8_9TELE
MEQVQCPTWHVMENKMDTMERLQLLQLNLLNMIKLSNKVTFVVEYFIVLISMVTVCTVFEPAEPSPWLHRPSYSCKSKSKACYNWGYLAFHPKFLF